MPRVVRIIANRPPDARPLLVKGKAALNDRKWCVAAFKVRRKWDQPSPILICGRISVDVRELRRAFPSAVDASARNLAIGKAPEANLSAVLLLQVSEPLFMRCD